MGRHTSDNVSIDLVALAVLRRESKIVLVRQIMGNDGTPGWTLPGGLVEAGELVTEALRREVREEAGLDVGAVARLAYSVQIDRPAHRAQTVACVFEVTEWGGTLACDADPDGEVTDVESVPLAEAIARLERNGGWPCFQTPVLAYLRGERAAGALWLYREDAAGRQHCVDVVEGGSPANGSPSP